MLDRLRGGYAPPVGHVHIQFFNNVTMLKKKLSVAAFLCSCLL